MYEARAERLAFGGYLILTAAVFLFLALLALTQ
jgi:hypothetical protein